MAPSATAFAVRSGVSSRQLVGTACSSVGDVAAAARSTQLTFRPAFSLYRRQSLPSMAGCALLSSTNRGSTRSSVKLGYGPPCREQPYRVVLSSFVGRRVGLTRLGSEQRRGSLQLRVTSDSNAGESVQIGKRQTKGLEEASKPISADGGQEKECVECKRTKPMVDFAEMKASPDGRKAFCRACAAVTKAKREGSDLHHLALSVEEAWEQAKHCTKCGRLKELRDFARFAGSKTGTGVNCRSCFADRWARYDLITEALMGQQVCACCLETKPLDAFYLSKNKRNGRDSYCKPCKSSRARERRAKLAEESARIMYIQIKTKVCFNCREEKSSSEFYPRGANLDGLKAVCITCSREERREKYKANRLTSRPYDSKA